MHATLIQLDIAWENREENFHRVTAMLDASPPPRGSLVVLPEMFATGFSQLLDRIVEPPNGQTMSFLVELARSRGVHVLGGLVEQADTGRGLNRAVVITPDGNTIARYSKIHPFTLGGEAACIDAGSEVLVTRISDVSLSPFVCYDLRFPEVFRVAARRGAELFAVIANWPAAREAHWVTLLTARAIENQAYVLGVNRCGSDPKFTYSGRSLIIDPRGNIIADAANGQGVITAALDMEALRAWRRDFPAIRDMHPGFAPGQFASGVAAAGAAPPR